MKVYCRQCSYLLSGPSYIEDQKQYPDGLCERCQDEEFIGSGIDFINYGIEEEVDEIY